MAATKYGCDGLQSCSAYPSPKRQRGVFAPVDRARTLLGALVLTVVLSLNGCGDGDTSRDGDPSTEGTVGVTRTAQEGPVTLTLTASPAEFDIEQHLVVRLEAVAEKGVTLHVDHYERALAADENRFEYRIVSARQAEAKPTADGKLRWMYECELEFFLPGEYELPPATVSFVDTRQPNEPGGSEAGEPDASTLQTLATETLPIIVHQPADAELSQEELATIKTLPPVDLPREWSLAWSLVVVGAIAAIVIAFLLLRRRRQRADVVEVIPADIWARRELAALVAEDLIAKRLVQLFYYRISGVVRGYVERRFDVSAPEMTTEEFLTAAATDRRFGDNNTDELVKFLDACDLVKYARHEPPPDESDSLIQAAGSFVERTREHITTTGVDESQAASSQEQAA